MKTILVNTPGKTYNVVIDKNLLSIAGKMAAHVISTGTAAIVTDDIVDGLYAPTLEKSLKEAGYEVIKYVIQNGEQSKNPAELIKLLNFLAENHLTGSDAVFALGGGVVGDLAGFAASIYLRGIHFIQLPTTLLAAVDSSVGGKTAIDLPAGKNLAGAYYQPDLVICDYLTLNTLSPETFSDGYAETIKYGVICDESLLELAEDLKPSCSAATCRIPEACKSNDVSRSVRADDQSDLREKILAACIKIKSEIVSRDERDKGERQLLNFGHTFGHAIEKCSDYTISHGKAVSIGMIMMTCAAVKKGFCDVDSLDRLQKLLLSQKLPVKTDFSAEELYQVLLSDKKRKGDTITLVVPHRIGKCMLHKVSLSEAREFLLAGMEA